MKANFSKKTVTVIAGAVVMVVVLVILLINILPNKATKSVIEQIDSIGTVSLSSESIINNALNDYDALTDKEKNKVSNYETLVDAQKVLKNLLDEENTQKVTELISDLSYNYPKSLEELKSIKNEIDILFNSLSEEYKEKVNNYDEYIPTFIDKVADCVKDLSEEYKFDEATSVVNEYDELMTESQHLEILSYIGRWKCFKVDFDKREQEIKNMFKGSAVRVTRVERGRRVIEVEKVCVKDTKVHITSELFAYHVNGQKNFQIQSNSYTFDMNLSDNTISNITLLDK